LPDTDKKPANRRFPALFRQRGVDIYATTGADNHPPRFFLKNRRQSKIFIQIKTFLLTPVFFAL
jgi:hypothetical protein